MKWAIHRSPVKAIVRTCQTVYKSVQVCETSHSQKSSKSNRKEMWLFIKAYRYVKWAIHRSPVKAIVRKCQKVYTSRQVCETSHSQKSSKSNRKEMWLFIKAYKYVKWAIHRSPIKAIVRKCQKVYTSRQVCEMSHSQKSSKSNRKNMSDCL